MRAMTSSWLPTLKSSSSGTCLKYHALRLFGVCMEHSCAVAVYKVFPLLHANRQCHMQLDSKPRRWPWNFLRPHQALFHLQLDFVNPSEYNVILQGAIKTSRKCNDSNALNYRPQALAFVEGAVVNQLPNWRRNVKVKYELAKIVILVYENSACGILQSYMLPKLIFESQVPCRSWIVK